MDVEGRGVKEGEMENCKIEREGVIGEFKLSRL